MFNLENETMSSDVLVSDIVELSALIASRTAATTDPGSAMSPDWFAPVGPRGDLDGAEIVETAIDILGDDLSGYPDPLLAPAVEIAAALRSERWARADYYAATRQRIAETEARLNAHVRQLEPEAFSVGSDDLPLVGLTVAVKDIFDVRGTPTIANSVSRHGEEPAEQDAVAVERLRAAGAFLISKTVTQEFAAGVISHPARNPWDPDRIPGGSSGGSAVAVAVGAAALAFGSDTGGSIRIPASVCGVVGLKPTFGSVSRGGVFPLSWSLDTVGPIARTVRDAAMMFLLMRDPALVARDDDRIGWIALLAGADASRPLTGQRIGISARFFLDRLIPDVRIAFDTAAEALRSLGAEVIDVDWEDADLARAAATVINRVESAAVHAAGVASNPDGYGRELKDRLLASQRIASGDYIRALQARNVTRSTMANTFVRNGLTALLAPATAATAARADDLNVRYDDGVVEPVSNAYLRLAQPFNATGQPVLCLPCGFDRQGLPIGLQIATAPGHELTACRIGAAYEAATDWHRRLPTVLVGN